MIVAVILVALLATNALPFIGHAADASTGYHLPGWFIGWTAVVWAALNAALLTLVFTS